MSPKSQRASVISSIKSGKCIFCKQQFKSKRAVNIHLAKVHKKEYYGYLAKEKIVPLRTAVYMANKDRRPSSSLSRASSVSRSEMDKQIPIAKVEDVAKYAAILKPWEYFGASNKKAPAKTNIIGIAPEPPIGDLILCQICKEEFYGSKYLNWHVRNEHSNEFGENEDLRASGKVEAVKPKSLKSNPIPNGVPKHRLGVPSPASPGTFKCPHCTKTFGNRLVFKRHTYQCAKEGGPAAVSASAICCGICNKGFADIHLLVEHQQTAHQGPSSKPLSPRKNSVVPKKAVADAESEENSDLPSSEDESDAGVLYDCLFCDVSVVSDSRLLTHVKNQHSDLNSKKIECPFCDFSTQNVVDLHYHSRSHDELKPFQCGKCSKKFRSKAALKSHFNSHTNVEKTHKCKKCQKSYFYFSSLKRHMAGTH